MRFARARLGLLRRRRWERRDCGGLLRLRGGGSGSRFGRGGEAASGFSRSTLRRWLRSVVVMRRLHDSRRGRCAVGRRLAGEQTREAETSCRSALRAAVRRRLRVFGSPFCPRSSHFPLEAFGFLSLLLGHARVDAVCALLPTRAHHLRERGRSSGGGGVSLSRMDEVEDVLPDRGRVARVVGVVGVGCPTLRRVRVVRRRCSRADWAAEIETRIHPRRFTVHSLLAVKHARGCGREGRARCGGERDGRQRRRNWSTRRILTVCRVGVGSCKQRRIKVHSQDSLGRDKLVVSNSSVTRLYPAPLTRRMVDTRQLHLPGS